VSKQTFHYCNRKATCTGQSHRHRTVWNRWSLVCTLKWFVLWFHLQTGQWLSLLSTICRCVVEGDLFEVDCLFIRSHCSLLRSDCTEHCLIHISRKKAFWLLISLVTSAHAPSRDPFMTSYSITRKTDSMHFFTTNRSHFLPIDTSRWWSAIDVLISSQLTFDS